MKYFTIHVIIFVEINKSNNFKACIFAIRECDMILIHGPNRG